MELSERRGDLFRHLFPVGPGSEVADIRRVGAVDRADLAARYPLQLLSPPRPQFLNSTFANEAHHRALAGDPTIELACEDAARRGLGEGQWVEVLNDRGEFRARVALTGAPETGITRTREAGIAHYIDLVGRNVLGPETSMPLFTSPVFDLTLTSIFTPLCFGGRVQPRRPPAMGLRELRHRA